MDVMEIVYRLSMLLIACSNNYEKKKDQDMYKNIIALKRAIQLIITLDLKNEMELIENE